MEKKEEKMHSDQLVNSSYDPPCRTCERKGCGSYRDQCEKYLAFRAQKKAISEARKEHRKTDNYVYDAKMRMKTSPNLTIFKPHKK